jgi:hypothetical protein
MKKSLVLLLLLAGLVGLAVVTKKQKEARLSENVRRGVTTREYLVPNLDVNAVKTVKIQDKNQTVTLKQGAEQWIVEERNGYGVDFGKISQSLMELRETKIAGKQLLGKGAWAGENVLEPAEGVTEGVGTLVKLLDEKGGDLATLVLGGDVKVSGGNSPQMGAPSQRLVRIPQDEDSLWMVGTTLGSFQAKPEEWLDKAFIAVQDLASVTVTAPDAAESWKASRASKDITDYTLEGLKEGDEFDPAKLTLASLLTSASFNDVKPKAEAAELLKGAHKAVLTTFDGFTYELQVAKQSKDGADKFFMSVAVKADLPKARKPGADEKEEDKKRLDDEYKAAQDTLKAKLEKEQKLQSWVFEVAEYTVNNLLVKRSDLIKKPEPAAPAPEASGTTTTPAAPAPAPAPAAAPEASTPPAAEAPAAMKAPVTVTTPPVAVPPVPKVEVKPAPAPDANPAEVPPPPAKP